MNADSAAFPLPAAVPKCQPVCLAVRGDRILGQAQPMGRLREYVVVVSVELIARPELGIRRRPVTSHEHGRTHRPTASTAPFWQRPVAPRHGQPSSRVWSARIARTVRTLPDRAALRPASLVRHAHRSRRTGAPAATRTTATGAEVVVSRPIRRILSGPEVPVAAIHLGRRLPAGSSGLPGGLVGRAALPLLGLAPGGVYRATRVTPGAGALLPHRFTLACAGLASRPSAVCSLWHFPAGHPDWALPSTLPYGVRTFLGRVPVAHRGGPVRGRLADSPPGPSSHVGPAGTFSSFCRCKGRSVCVPSESAR